MAGRLQQLNFERGVADAQVYRHPQTGSLISVHADDFLVAVPVEKEEWIRRELDRLFTIKWTGEINEDHWERYLGKLWRVVDDAVQVRVDSTFYEGILEQMRMNECKPALTPCVSLSELRKDAAEPISDVAAELYRTVVGKCMWVAPQRPDISFTVKELARYVRSPTQTQWTMLKKLVRFLSGTKYSCFALQLKRQISEGQLVCQTDASWASGPGCRSTSGGVILVQGFPLLHFSRTQTTVSQSSCEAELVAINMMAGEGLAAQQVLRHVGVETSVLVLTDSKACLGVAHRRGLGRLKHLQIKQLWVQDALREGRIALEKIATADNMADMMTKPLERGRLMYLASLLGMHWHSVDEEGATLMVLASRLAAVICLCGAEMQLDVGEHTGVAGWLCLSCGRRRSWASVAASTAAPAAATSPTYMPEPSAPPPMPEPGPEPMPSASTSSASASAPTGAHEHAPRPTGKQMSYLRVLAHRLGLPNSVLRDITTRDQASIRIDEYVKRLADRR